MFHFWNRWPDKTGNDLILSEVSHKEKDKYCMISLIGESKKNRKRSRLKDIESKLVVTSGERERGGTR